MVIAERPLVVRILLRPPEAEVTTLFLSLLKEMGDLVLILSVPYGLRHVTQSTMWRLG